MALPTTRRGRYLRYRARARAKDRRALAHANEKPPIFWWFDPTQLRRPPVHAWPIIRLPMVPLHVYLKKPAFGPLVPLLPLPYRSVIAEAHQHVPPYVARLHPENFLYHPREPLCDFFHRVRTRLKIDRPRATARDRLAYGAKNFHRSWDFWPHWDPELRVPFMLDVDFVPRTPYALQLSTQR